MPGKYLLTAYNPSSNPYLIYDESKSKEALQLPKTELGNKISEIMSVGPWLYALEFNLDANGQPIKSPLRIISKET
jgi:hypothetical protein